MIKVSFACLSRKRLLTPDANVAVTARVSAMTKYEGLPLQEKLERYRSALAVSKHSE